MPQDSRKPLKPVAVVIGVEHFVGLQTARILNRHNVPVIGITDHPENNYCRTNACKKILFAETSGEGLVRALIETGPSFDQKAVLFPCSDLSVLTISRHREELNPWYHISLPSADVVETLMNKLLFYPFAQEAGLPIPKTFLLHSKEEVQQAAKALRYPAALKPPVKTQNWVTNTRGVKAYKVASEEELIALYDRCHSWVDELMVQEWVEGPETNLYSCNCYFGADAKPLVTFVARKLRQWPPQTGYSCLGEECRNDVVLEETLRLFKSVDYHGLGYLEIKRDARTGDYVIIEPNIGRPTGRSAICEAGGVELLYTAYCDATGLPLPENRTQQYNGAKWIFWLHDLKSALHYWKRGELTLKEWRHSLRGKKQCAVFSWSDPKPFWLDVTAAYRRRLSRLFKKRVSK